MNEHLPECDTFRFAYGDGYGGCICEWLRACEQRVCTRNDEYAYVAAQAESKGRVLGWNEALHAAQKAIFGIPHFGDFVDTVDAFAAIDNLRKEEK